MENEPGSQGLFCFMLIHISHGIKYQFLKKIFDVINKMYTFEFENLTIFIAFPLPSMETFFNLIWRPNEPADLSFLLHSSM